jgi:hypothetical protein
VTQGSLKLEVSTPTLGDRPATSDAPTAAPRPTTTNSSRPSSEGSQRKVAFADEEMPPAEEVPRRGSGNSRTKSGGRSGR